MEIQQDVGAQTLADAALQATFGLLPVWAEQNCRRAVRTALCMAHYAPLNLGTEKAYCLSSCTSTLDVCASLWALGGDLDALKGLYYSGCTGGEPCLSSDYTQTPPLGVDATQCPGSLVVPDEQSVKGDGDIHGIDGTGCAISCPSFWFSDSKWKQLHKIAEACLWVSDFLALVTAVCVTLKKQYLLAGYTGSVVLGVLTELIVLSVNGAAEGHNRLICDGNAGYVDQHPAVVFSSLMFVLCVEIGYACGFLIVLQVWLKVAMGMKLTQEQEQRLPIPFMCLSVIVTIIVAAGGGLGYDYETQPLAPYILFGDKEPYYWVFFAPLFAYANIQFLLMVHTLYCAQTALVQAVRSIKKTSYWEAVKESVWTNRRMICFLLFHVLSAMYIFYTALYFYGVYPDTLDRESEKYVECLLEEGSADPEAASGECGDTPKVPLWAYMSLNMFKASCGVVPFFIYGTSGFGSTQLKKAKEVLSKTSSGKGGSLAVQRSMRSKRSKSSGGQLSSVFQDAESPVTNDAL